MTLEELEALQPDVPWRLPVKIWNADAQAWRYLCRVCLNIGLPIDSQILYETPEQVTKHQQTMHGQP